MSWSHSGAARRIGREAWRGWFRRRRPNGKFGGQGVREERFMKWRQRLISVVEGALAAWLIGFLIFYGMMKVVDRQFLPRLPTLDEPAHALDGY